MQIRRWEILYALLNSWLKGLFWLVPILVSIFAVSYTTSSQYVTWESAIVLLAFFALIGYLNVVLETKIKLLQASLEETISLLREDRNRWIESVSQREPRSFPDGGQIQLKEYNHAIESIRAHGYIEFECEFFPARVDYKAPISVVSEAPGMSKYYLQVLQEGQFGPTILEPFGGGRSTDHTFTWFDNIFQILGHASPGISERVEGYSSAGTSAGRYLVSYYRFYRHKGKALLRIFA